MSTSIDEGRREAIVFVLKKLRQMTLDGFKFGHEYYDFEFYKGFDEAQKPRITEYEPDALRYLDQKGVLKFTEASELDESVVSALNEKKFQQEIARFGLVDGGTSIQDDTKSSGGSAKRPTLNSRTGEVNYRGKSLLLSPSLKQDFVVKACLRSWGKPVPDTDIIDELSANGFDPSERVVRDSVPRLNEKFKEVFQIENAFRYKNGFVSIDPSQFETL